MFKTSGGKYIAPGLMENVFKASILIEQLMIVGEGQKFAGALILPNFESLRAYCHHKKIAYSTDAEMILNPAIIDKYNRIVEHYNSGFAQFEKVKKYSLISDKWSIETGELTPKLSLKRKIIKEKYGKVINSIYNNC